MVVGMTDPMWYRERAQRALRAEDPLHAIEAAMYEAAGRAVKDERWRASEAVLALPNSRVADASSPFDGETIVVRAAVVRATKRVRPPRRPVWTEDDQHEARCLLGIDA